MNRLGLGLRLGSELVLGFMISDRARFTVGVRVSARNNAKVG